MDQSSYKPCGSWLAIIEVRAIMMVMCTEVNIGGFMEDASSQAVSINISTLFIIIQTFKISERERGKNMEGSHY
jgi:hypothetical protein